MIEERKPAAPYRNSPAQRLGTSEEYVKVGRELSVLQEEKEEITEASDVRKRRRERNKETYHGHFILIWRRSSFSLDTCKDCFWVFC